MSNLGPLDFQRLAALTMSGFESSEAALRAVAEHVDNLCADIVQRHQASLDSILAGREVTELTGEDKNRARAAWSGLHDAEQIRTSIVRTLGIYGGILFRSKPTEQEAETALFLLAKLADDLVQVGAGYMIGKQEVDIPPSVMTASDAGRLGAAASQIYKDKQVGDWNKRADPLINEVLGKHPSWSGDKIAQEVINLARERRIAMPSTPRTVGPYVRKVMAKRDLSEG